MSQGQKVAGKLTGLWTRSTIDGTVTTKNYIEKKKKGEFDS